MEPPPFPLPNKTKGQEISKEGKHMGGGKVTPDDEEPPPQNKAEGAIKKHKRYSLKPGDTQETAHMQMAAGREHGRLGRSGNSAWREAGPPQGRRAGGGGARNTSREEKSSEETPRPPHSHRRVSGPRDRCPVFLFQSKKGPGAPSGFKENGRHCSPCPSGGFLHATTPTP